MNSYKNQLVSALVIFSSLVQAPLLAQAQVIQDLPNLDAGQAAPQSDFVSSIEVKGISQKANGTLYVVDLKKPLSLSRIDLKVAKSRVRLYAVMLVTDNGARVAVKNFAETDVARGLTISSETLNQSDRVTSIEILAESAEALADISVLVVADREKADLTLRETKAPKAPAAPTAPAAPAAPAVPVAPKKDLNPKVPAPKVEAPKPESPKVPAPKVEKAPKQERTVTNANRLAKGAQVIVPTRSYARATVASMQSNGTYTLKFISGALSGQVGDGWSREDLAAAFGCTKDFCVGDEVYNTDRNMAKVRVTAVESNGKHILLFLDGPSQGLPGNNWPASDLTTLKKCGKDFCVGDTAFLFGENRVVARVLIIAIQQGGEQYGVFFTEGTLQGKRGNNWGYKDLAKLKGCGKKYCVGDALINVTKNNARVVVAGVQNNGKYIIFFESGPAQGKYGENWDDVDLRRRK